MIKGQDSNQAHSVVGFDMDGVLIDHAANKIAIAREFGVSVELAETPSEILRGKFTDRAEYERFQALLYEEHPLADKAPVMPGAREILDELRRRGVPYFLISRRRSSEVARVQLAAKGLWGTYFDDGNALFVRSIVEKAEHAARFGVSVYVDDERRVLAKMEGVVPDRVLFDPHGAFPAGGYRTIATWTDGVQVLGI